MSVPISIHVEDTDSYSDSVDLSCSLDLTRSQSSLRAEEISESPPSTNIFLLIPDDSTSDMSSPSSTEESTGLFMLRKDSERRATLHKVLTDYISHVVSSIQQSVPQYGDGSTITPDHITKLVICLRDNIRSPDRKQLTSGLLELRAMLVAASVPLNSLQVVLFNFQDAVKKVLKQQKVKPHWMFALDNLLRQAVQDAITVLLPELKLHLQSSFESEDNTSEELFADPDTPVALVPDQLVAPAYTQQPAPANDVLLRANPKPADFSLNTNWPLREDLRDLRLETRRLLNQLSEKETEYHELLRNSLWRKQQQIDALRKESVNEDVELASQKSSRPEKKALVRWLKTVSVDQDTINKLLSHEFTLDCLLRMAAKDDLMYCGIRGGMLCRIWAAVTAYRKTQLSTHNEDSEDTLL